MRFVDLAGATVLMLLSFSCEQRQSPFDITSHTKVSIDPHSGTSTDDDPSDWANRALGNLLKLRTRENKDEFDRAIQYLAKRRCGNDFRGPAIDIDTFYPLHLLPQLKRVGCGEFTLKNRNIICGPGPKARGTCVDVIYSDYDENGNPM